MTAAGDGPFDDDADAPPPPLLPPEDRLWRHPSERRAASEAPTVPIPVVVRSGRPALTWIAAVGAGLVGSVATVAVLGMTGRLDGTDLPTVAAPAEVPVLSAPAVVSLRSGSASVDVAALAAAAAPALVRVERDGEAVASGAVVDSSGVVITSAQAVAGAYDCEVTTADGRRVRAEVVSLDLTTDVAVLVAEGDEWATLALGTSSGLRAGEPAVAVTADVGTVRSPVVSAGVVAGVDRSATTPDGEALYGLVHTDTSVGPLGAGAVVLDRRGHVVGLATAVTGGGAGTYAVSADVVRAVLAQLAANGEVRHAWLGIGGADTAGEPGVSVAEVVPGSPADQAGIRPGEVIVGVGSETVRSMAELLGWLRARAPGDRVAITVTGPDGPRRVTLQLAPRPTTTTIPVVAPTPDAEAGEGAEVVPPAVAGVLGLGPEPSEEPGAELNSVTPEGPPPATPPATGSPLSAEAATNPTPTTPVAATDG